MYNKKRSRRTLGR